MGFWHSKIYTLQKNLKAKEFNFRKDLGLLKGSIIHRALNVISPKKKSNKRMLSMLALLQKGFGTFSKKYVFAWVFPALSDDIAYMSWFIYFVFILEFRRGKLFIIGLVIFLLLSVNIHVYTTQWIYIFVQMEQIYSFIIYGSVVWLVFTWLPYGPLTRRRLVPYIFCSRKPPNSNMQRKL